MESLDDFSFYKECYFHELDTKEKLLVRLQIVMGMQMVMLTAVATMVVDFKFGFQPLWTVLFFFSLYIFFIPFLDSILETKRAFWGNEYQLLSCPSVIQDYKNQLQLHVDNLTTYNKSNPGNASQIEDHYVTKQLNAFILDRMHETTSYNYFKNIERSKYIHDAIQHIFYAVPCLFVAAVCFVLAKYEVVP